MAESAYWIRPRIETSKQFTSAAAMETIKVVTNKAKDIFVCHREKWISRSH
jgi:hypothetical protein